MSIQVACPGCSKQFRVSGDHAGKRVKCPHCQTVFEIPLPQSPAATPESASDPAAPMPRPTPAPRRFETSDAQSGTAQFVAGQGTASAYGPSKLLTGDEDLTDSQRTMGTVGLILGIVALVGELASPVLMCCCGIFGLFTPGVMTIPSGIGLALSFQSAGNLKTGGVIVNAIALVIGVLCLIGAIAVVAIYGVALFQMQQNQPGGF